MTFRIDNRQIGGEIGSHISGGLEAQDGHVGNAPRNVNVATIEVDVEDRQEDAEDNEEERWDVVEPVMETKKDVRIGFKMHTKYIKVHFVIIFVDAKIVHVLRKVKCILN